MSDEESRNDDQKRRALLSEARSRAILVAAVDAIITIDEHGIVESMNPGAEKLFGYAEAEVIGKNVKMLMPSPYREEHDTYLANYLKTGQKKIIGSGREVVGRRKDGSSFPMHLAVSELRIDETRMFLGIARDITELKNAIRRLEDSEARNRAILDAAVDPIITIDERGIVESMNPAAERLFGYPAAEVVGQNVKILMPSPYREEHDSYLANYLRTGRKKIIGIGREVIGQRKDGSTFPMELAVSEAQLANGKRFTGIVRDITDRKKLEEELRLQAERLTDANRRKDEFLAMLAHELRNPLAAINNTVLLLKDVNEEHHRWSRMIIERQVGHLTHLIDDLLDVSRITRGKIKLRKEVINPFSVVGHAVEAVKPLIEERKHKLSVSFPSGDLRVEADSTRLEQIIVNLLTNAAKYTETGGHISLAAEREDSHFVIRVRDTGIGISPDALPQMFELFSQGDRSLARSEGGLGIGLTIVKKLTELHNGSVAAQSAGPGQGSEFIVRIPLSTKQVEASRPSGPPAGADGATVPAQVLVVDDNVDMATGLARLLDGLGHKVVTAYDGWQAIKAVQLQCPDFVLLDIGLPGMDGYEVARQMRKIESCKDAVIIAVTGYGQEEDRRRTREAGIDHHIVKPIDFNVLVSLVRKPATATSAKG